VVGDNEILGVLEVLLDGDHHQPAGLTSIFNQINMICQST
jgi:hypothetical protein